MRNFTSDDRLLLDRLLTLAWRAAQMGAVIDPRPIPYHGAPEEECIGFRLARWVSPDLSAGACIGPFATAQSLDELERQIRELERERFEAYEGGAA